MQDTSLSSSSSSSPSPPSFSSSPTYSDAESAANILRDSRAILHGIDSGDNNRSSSSNSDNNDKNDDNNEYWTVAETATTMTREYDSIDDGYSPSEHDELLMEHGIRRQEDDDHVGGGSSKNDRSSSDLVASSLDDQRRQHFWCRPNHLKRNPAKTLMLMVSVLLIVVFAFVGVDFMNRRKSTEGSLSLPYEQQQQIIRSPPTEFDFHPYHTNDNDNRNADVDDDDNLHQSFTANKFFDTVLPWKKKTKNRNTNHDTDSGKDDGDDEDGNHPSMWFEAALEFCSNDDGTSYAFGLPGLCVPGQPAPLIRMYPKHHYRLTLINTADINTNLHTHGLHISGVGNVDDVTRDVEPGQCLVYEYYLLEDSDVGTFWYHPHRHPLVSRSAYGGGYGMLIIDENPRVLSKYYPPHLQNFLSRDTDNEILLQFSSMLSPAADKATRYNRINGLERTPSSEKPHLLTIVVNKHTYYRVRISAVVYSDSINYVEFIPHDACDVIRPIAYDGVYRSEIPHPTINSPKHFLTVSSRLDVALRCQQDVDIYFHQGQQQLIEGTQTLKMVHVHVQPNSAVDTCIIDSLNSTSSKVVVLTNPQTPSSPYWDDKKETTWNPRRPYYMPDLTDPFQVGQTWVDDTWTVSMDDYFTNGTKAVSVNQIVWDPSVAARSFDLNALVEWNLLRTQSHPFHAHINRMQVVQPGGCGHRYEEGEYFDTITADQDECLVRMKFFDYSGRLVIHCHRFGHEDKGMMTWVDILGGHGHGVKATPQVDCLAAPP